MRNNITALAHPTIKRKIRHAVWLAKLEAYAKRRDGISYQGQSAGRQYVANRKGNNILRIDWFVLGGLVVYGDQSRNITAMVAKALA